METLTTNLAIQRASERAHFDHGWLQTDHSFSFADYYDPGNVNWGALRVFNDDVIAPGKGFGTHPHRDMEILTYVLDGELTHRDSMGNVGTVTAGGVQYLSAGTGIAHSEYNGSQTRPLHLVQMWVVPRARGLEPRYGQIDCARADRDGRWLTIASGERGVEAPITLWQDATAYVSCLSGERLEKPITDGRYAFLFVASGPITLNDEPLGTGDAARIRGPLRLDISGEDAELVLLDLPSA